MFNIGFRTALYYHQYVCIIGHVFRRQLSFWLASLLCGLAYMDSITVHQICQDAMKAQGAVVAGQ
jgi:hypothetical protein